MEFQYCCDIKKVKTQIYEFNAKIKYLYILIYYNIRYTVFSFKNRYLQLLFKLFYMTQILSTH